VGYVVESCLPVTHLGTRSFRGDDHDEAVTLPEGLDALRYQVVGLPPIHRDASQPLEQPTKGGAEDRVFSQPEDLHPEGQGENERHGQIPVGGMGCGDHDELRRIGNTAFLFPAKDPHVKDGHKV